jgi:hypothetical protein
VLVGSRPRRATGRGPSNLLVRLRRCALANLEDGGHLAPLRSLTDLDTKQRPRGDSIVPSRLESTDVKEDVSGSVGKLGEAETLLWVEPLDDRVGRWAGSVSAYWLRRTELVARLRGIIIVVKIAPTGAPVSSLSRDSSS